MNDSIGDRFKEYERVFDYSLPRRLPMVIRVDGRAFHGLVLEKPFDSTFFACMCDVAKALCGEIQGSVLAYLQSDEISIIARDDMKNETQPWVGKRLSKINSLSAAIATAEFSSYYEGKRHFDCRAFVLPDLNEVTNYLIWRQQDATRNSISMAARAKFSHKDCHSKNSNELIDMLREAGSPWEETPTQFKRGAVCQSVKVLRTNRIPPNDYMSFECNEWHIDTEPPIFTQDREYIERIYKASDGIQ